MPLNILFAAPEDAFGGFLHKLMEAAPGYRYHASGRFSEGDLSGVDVLIPTMSTVGEKWIAQSTSLALIQQCGAGTELIDIAAATRCGVAVANVPAADSGNADSVAEIALYLMIGLARDFRGMARKFNQRLMGQPAGLSLDGKTVGLVGLGGIGRALVTRLKPFGVKLIGVRRTPRADPDLDGVGGMDELDTLLARADFVVIAVPAAAETEGLFNAATLGRMKPGAFLVNVARGGIVERDALYQALASGRLAGAGLDVFWREPPDPADPIFEQNLLCTPHIGGATDVAGDGIVRAVVANLDRLGQGLEPLHCLNPEYAGRRASR